MLPDGSARARSQLGVAFDAQLGFFAKKTEAPWEDFEKSDGFLQAGVMISLPCLPFDPPPRPLPHLAQCWVPGRHSAN